MASQDKDKNKLLVYTSCSEIFKIFLTLNHEYDASVPEIV